MTLPDNDFQILKLTDKFYNTYPKKTYPEILEKRKRAYNCLLFQTHYDYYICVPYRTEITHKYAYHFKNSLCSKAHKSGLDYTKIIIINNGDYLKKMREEMMLRRVLKAGEYRNRSAPRKEYS